MALPDTHGRASRHAHQPPRPARHRAAGRRSACHWQAHRRARRAASVRQLAGPPDAARGCATAVALPRRLPSPAATKCTPRSRRHMTERRRPMRRFTIILALLAVAAVSPAAALGKAKGTDRPSSGKSSSTTTVDLATGTGSVAGSGQLSHIGPVHVHERHHVVHPHRTGHVQLHAHGSHRGGQRRRDLHDRHRDGDVDAPPEARRRWSARSPAAPVASPTPAERSPARSPA